MRTSKPEPGHGPCLWPPLVLLAVGGGAGAAASRPVTWAEIAAQPAPPPGERIAYGADPLEFGELRLPAGGDVRLRPVPAAGHFDLIAPLAPAWQAVRAQVHALAGPTRPGAGERLKGGG